MRIETVRELVADEMPEQQAARGLRHVRPDHGQAERFAATQPLGHGRRTAAEILRVALDELDRRHHLAVPRRLKKPDVLDVGVDDVHVDEIDLLAAESPPQLTTQSPRSSRRRRAGSI